MADETVTMIFLSALAQNILDLQTSKFSAATSILPSQKPLTTVLSFRVPPVVVQLRRMSDNRARSVTAITSVAAGAALAYYLYDRSADRAEKRGITHDVTTDTGTNSHPQRTIGCTRARACRLLP